MRGHVSRHHFAIVAAMLGIAGGAVLHPALSWLDRERRHHAELAAVARALLPTAAPVVAPGAAFHGSESAAAAALQAAVRDPATREGALIERIEPTAAPVPGLVAAHVIFSGSARTMLRLIESLESRTPAMRLPHYRLATSASGQSLRLEADLVLAFTMR